MKKLSKEQIQKLFNYFQKENYEHVIRECRKLLKKYPNSSALYNLLGLSLQQINNFDDAKNSYLKAIELDPKNLAVLNNLGSIFRIMEDFDKAKKYLTEVLEVNPNYINALSNYGNLKRELNNFDGAIKLYKKALQIDNKQFIIHHNLALAYQGIGEFDLSKKHALTVLELNPEHTLSDKMLSLSIKYTKENEHFKSMKNKLNKENLTDKQKIELNFAISKAYEDMGEYEKSFIHMNDGNKTKRKKLNYNIKKDEDLFSQIKNSFLDLNLEANINENHISDKIIFICGMPRSGTTLIEQIIASHKNVYGAGELNYLSKVLRKNFFTKNILQKEAVLNKKNNKENIASEYLNFLNSHSINENMITDKAPLNFRWIGFIKIFFPNSKIIHCSRDSKDNCLSLYKNHFDSDSLNWCYDEKDLSKYYNLYNNLMKFWKEKIPDFIYDARYEDVVQNQEIESKKILKFCNLDWDPNCLNFYKNKKTPIKTASIVQARKPIYKTSLKLNEKYSNYFQELFASLN